MSGKPFVEPFIITEINFADYKDQILELRHNCRKDKDPGLSQKLFPAGMSDGFDEMAIHWGMVDEEQRLVASARMSVHRNVSELPDRYLFSDIWDKDLPSPVASLNRLSVATSHQGRGISADMDRVRMLKARRIGCQSICGTAHGNRARKLIADGFLCYHSNLLSKLYGTNPTTGELQPLDFYYQVIPHNSRNDNMPKAVVDMPEPYFV